MAHSGVQTNEMRAFAARQPKMDGIAVTEEVVASPERGQVEGADAISINVPTRVHLNLEDLKCFEVVDRQYQRWGVTFTNCVAIQPSNPAFPVHSGTTVLMGAPKSGFLEVIFNRPVQMVSCIVTSSQRTVLAGYDRDRQVVAQDELPCYNLANSDSRLPPNTLLSLRALNIHRITVSAFDGQFTIDDLTFIF